MDRFGTVRNTRICRRFVFSRIPIGDDADKYDCTLRGSLMAHNEVSLANAEYLEAAHSPDSREAWARASRFRNFPIRRFRFPWWPPENLDAEVRARKALHSSAHAAHVAADRAAVAALNEAARALFTAAERQNLPVPDSAKAALVRAVAADPGRGTLIGAVLRELTDELRETVKGMGAATCAFSKALEELSERDLSDLDVPVIYLDGVARGDHHVLTAVGTDAYGRKHVLGLRGGASENAEVAVGLLEDLVARGLRVDRRRLFFIDGAAALRQAIGQVFGSSNLVQRSRNHKVRNVLSHLPNEQQEESRWLLRAMLTLEADEGMRKLEQYASRLEREWPSAAASLREGLAELFTVDRLPLPKPLRRYLTKATLIDFSHAAGRDARRLVGHRQSEEVTVRWAAR